MELGNNHCHLTAMAALSEDQLNVRTSLLQVSQREVTVAACTPRSYAADSTISDCTRHKQAFTGTNTIPSHQQTAAWL